MLIRADMATDCTPIVLAIRNNHAEVVRELLAAGAIVPPPTITSDPLMLSLLYPQAIYGMPPPFPGQPMSNLTDFYAQQGFFPGQGQQLTYMPFSNPSSRRETSTNALANLPPTEVAKTIPCRNFPNCKYGTGCVFFHPGPRAPGYFSGNPSYAPNGGFEQPYLTFQPNGMIPRPYYQSSNQSIPFQPRQNAVPDHYRQQPEQPQSSHDTQQHQQSQSQTYPQQLPQSDIPEATITPHDHTRSQSVPSAIAAPFVPAFQPTPNGLSPSNDVSSPPQSTDFGLSPMSTSMLAAPLPSIPPAEAFFAGSLPHGSVIMSPTGSPNGFSPGMSGPGHFRRQGFNQQPFGMPNKPFGHAKKLSYCGVPRSWGPVRGGGGGGSWRDGNPPPCAFFGQGKCRNGEFCKFPHLDAEGNDCEPLCKGEVSFTDAIQVVTLT